MFDLSSLIYTIPIILITITIHEFAHGKVADLLGDPTPRLSGRLTLNPIKHIDPIGFLMLILVRFGWAKPVPINPRNFINPLKGMAAVGAAGPLSNFTLAWILAVIIKFIPFDYNSTTIMHYAVWINVALAVFNLLPVPPLDGSRILAFFLPYRYTYILDYLEQYGFMILILFIFLFQDIILSLINFFYHLII
jgi:Zn-dependent protease